MIKDPTVKCYDSHSNDYDIYQATVVPHYRDMLGIVSGTCKRYLKPNSKIIDLGCGTGNASLAILGKLSTTCLLSNTNQSYVSVTISSNQGAGS